MLFWASFVVSDLFGLVMKSNRSHTRNVVSAETMKMELRILPLPLRKLRVSVRMTKS
jgi:hypothetical protein